MYSFDHNAFKDWAQEQGLKLSIARQGLFFHAQLNGCEEEGIGNSRASAIAHLANELSDQEGLFINGEQHIVPNFTEAVNVD